MKKRPHDCEKMQENISALVDGELSCEEADALMARIRKCAAAGCGECAELLEHIKIIASACRCPESDCVPPQEILSELRTRLTRRLDGSHWR